MLRYQRGGDLAARDALTRRFMPLARGIARRYTYTGEPFEDLAQVAYVGLTKAIDRFEPDRGVRFTSYAVPTIVGELRRYVRDRGWAVHVPRDLQERVLAMNRHTEALAKKLARSPSLREVARELGWTAEELLEVREAANAYTADSLDASIEDAQSGPGTTVVETLGSEDARYDLVDSRDALASAWRTLPERERRVLALRFTGELTQSEIGERIGFSQMHVSRLLRQALERLREAA
ncbi:MAG TPA: SigB/SigF/SigG family RNA polymerase sigma factor [Thermoleophilaceae bacterium]|nr:SigB/SigF/SigG family RNA polymerase sigma factor [Thermoleophilaceae bacterium]